MASRGWGARPRWAAALLAAAALLYLPGLGRLDLWAPDEPRFAQVAEELRSMRHGASGLVVLHLNGEVYTQKPPLYYWTVATLGALSSEGRVTELAARLPSALAGIGVVGLTLALGGRLFGGTSSAGLWGAAVLLTVFRFAHLARRAQLDVLLTLFEAVALLAFWRLETSDSETKRRRAAVLLHAALGLAVLTKGPVGLLPLGVIAAYLAWEGRLAELKRAVPWWGLAISLGPALVWVGGAAALSPPGYLDDAVVDNLFGRFFSGTSHARPLYYYLYQLPADFLPWSLIVPLALVHGVREARASSRPHRLLLAWLLVPLVFFSLSAGKRGLYLLPAYPAIALLCGCAIERSLSVRTSLPRWLAGVLCTAALLALLAGGWIVSSGNLEIAKAPGFALPGSFGVALAIAAGLGVVIARGGQATRAVAGLCCALLAMEMAVFLLLYPAFDDEKSPRPIALAAARVTPASEPLGIFDHRPLIAGIAYYADREVVEIEDPEGMRRFVSRGGRTIVCRSRHLERLRGVAPVEVTASLREGSRELVVARVLATQEPTRTGATDSEDRTSL